MMHRILRISSFLLVFTFLACTQQSKVDNKPQSFQYEADCTDAFYVERLNLIDSVYQSLVEDNYLPNAVVFVAHDGRVVYHKAFGWRNKERLNHAERMIFSELHHKQRPLRLLH